MTTYSFPTGIIPKRATWKLSSNTQRFTSPLDGTVQTLTLPGARWSVDYPFYLDNSNGRRLIGFLGKLSGQGNTFTIHDFSFEEPNGVGTGTPLVAGASQTGSTLDTDGWTVSQTGILLSGDYFEVNGELKIMTEDADSDAGGNATLTFQPPLRSSPPDSDPITVSKPTAIMMLDEDSYTYSVDQNKYYSINISCIEVF
ncbi:MAG: hypothetical protein JAY90_18555 [Candidatus Thiodiazotropha lotti]|nr:hypothetical protein [Candidatus Thiodiazotropha lotti]